MFEYPACPSPLAPLSFVTYTSPKLSRKQDSCFILYFCSQIRNYNYFLLFVDFIVPALDPSVCSHQSLVALRFLVELTYIVMVPFCYFIVRQSLDLIFKYGKNIPDLTMTQIENNVFFVWSKLIPYFYLTFI